MIIISGLINVFVIMLCVAIHYEFLFRLSKNLEGLKIQPKFKIIVGVLGALIAHSVEVWIFALAFYTKYHSGYFGAFEGNFDGSYLDCVYYSFTSFTTLGFGDIVPLGELRFLTGIESLTGLVLITWSASFLFYEMQKYWKTNTPD